MKFLIDKFEGMYSRIAPEKLPVILFQELVNWRTSIIEGWLKARDAAKGIITTGITSLQNMVEFEDKGGNRQLVILDGTTLKESVYSAGYGAFGSITNDERTAGSTVSSFNPVTDFKILRSGAGISAATDRPFWYGYIPERNRFADNETITAGKYLTDQDYRDVLTTFFGSTYPVLSVLASYKSSGGLTEKKTYTVLFSPVIDGQRGFPVLKRTINLSDISASRFAIGISFVVASADVAKFKRLTAIDIFVAEGVFEFDNRNENNSPAYFLERVDLNEESINWLRIDGTLDNTPASEKITIASFADWQSQRLLNIFVKDVTNDQIYQVTNYTENSTNIELTTSPVAQDSGSAELIFYSDWYDNGSGYEYRTFYDNDYKKLGSEMYEYLGIPVGDNGVEDLRYKLLAIAGKRSLAACFPGENSNKGYYSIANSPDIYPVLNEVEFRKDPTAIIDTRDEAFLVFYNDSADLITVFGDLNYRRSDNYLNIGATNAKAVTKVYDDFIAVFDYTGPYLLGASGLKPLGEELGDWWDSKLTAAQKATCVVSFNRLAQEIWFSFPDYTTSPYTTGIVFVYDLRAQKSGKQSPWYILKTDQLIKSACRAEDLHLLTGSATVIRDWNNTAPDEAFDCWLKMALLQNTEFDNRVNFTFLKAQFDGNMQLDLYKDNAVSADITRTLTDTKAALLHSVADRFDVKLTAADAEDGSVLKSVILNVDYLGK